MPRRVNRRRTAITQSVAAPIGGLNTRDSQDIMAPEDAIVLDNWWPDVGKVRVRKGYVGHATGVGAGDVETIAEYNDGATQVMLSCGGGSIYDATTAGAATSKKSGFTNDRWAWLNFNGSMGLVNGADAPQTFDGTTVSNMTVSGSGLTPADLIGGFAHQSRTYWWTDDSQDFWYSATNALGGALTKFQLSRVGQFGGKLVCCGSWDVSGGSDTWGGGGIGNDLSVFVMSSGEVIVYEGDDPGSNWNLVQVYRIGEPIGRDAVVKVGADLIIATRDGYVSMSDVARNGRVTPSGMITDKIAPSVRDDAGSFSANAGWQLIHFPAANMLLGNVPASTTAFRQWCMNTKTGAWCQFQDINARCWGRYGGDLYFGDGAGNVRKFWSGTDDNGAAISADAETAYSYFGDRGTVKRCAGLRPVLKGAGSFTGGIVAQWDFQTQPVSDSEISISPSVNWEDDTEVWGTGSGVWEEGSAEPATFWAAADGVGYAIGSRFRASTTELLEWSTTTYNLEPGMGLA